MKSTGLHILTILVFAISAYRCGENLSGPSTGDLFGPPQNLQAQSLDQSSVKLKWLPPQADSLVKAYIVQWGVKVDSVSRTTLSFTVGSLSVGPTTFVVRSQNSTGTQSIPVSITWAPAARFDSAYVVNEYDLQNPTSLQGLDVGTQTKNPSTLLIDANAVLTIDLLCYGGGNKQIALPLALWSAGLYQINFNQTKFSTVTNPSASLDFYQSSFPDGSTFSSDSVTVVDNTIYYVRVIGENQTFLYARLHVHVVPGLAFPNRRIEVRISLQRVTNLLFAENTTHHNHGG